MTVKHYRIRPLDAGGWFITPKLKFSTLHDLVEQYSKPENAGGLCHVLSNPCPKTTPTLNDLSHSTRDKWEIERSTIELKQMIGKGQFGEVHKAMWNKTRAVAVKTLKPGTMSTDAFLAEAQVMKSLTHKNIVQLLAVCTEEEPILIVTEYLENNSLLAYLRSKHNNKLELHVLIDIAANVADGMAYIEMRGLIHRDLAARNILLDSDLTAKVADFGLAKDDSIYEASQGAKFPVKWTSPEAGLRQTFTIKSDVWSFGIVLVEIITHGIIPYPGMSPHEVLNQVDRGMRHKQPDGCPDFLYEIMLKCWNKVPDNRPTFEYLADTLHNYQVSTENEYEEK
ncbi:hypothetical protein CAPTEDRAFT_204626 [Capitella teleta]|uniref:non-specific protein-tyrosine kinase n=1 Tax=Capitella teleta TaxID=283909 RepID=R7UUF7_CAPTE|nr:hypothetical protein CAPTEDRAFT_204626 [Capitella teleta]|eukprot:ELU07021.1 hypothetical protein CAPTEDRAFT_204626 [Capitella teleta]